jgi:glycosyltransferase involved in cell wall biosynthesis
MPFCAGCLVVSGPSYTERDSLAAVDGFMFTALELSRPWQVGTLVRREQDIFPVMEGSTDFCPQDRAAARQRTGMVGNPVFLWVGRLISTKDPLTVLAGFESALKELPSARIHGIPDASAFSGAGDDCRSEARQAVRCWVRCPTIKWRLPNSADYFLLGSHHEGSGFALAEALACGVVPIVTDIPSFRMMTDQGRLGELWPVGQAGACAAAILKAANRPLDEESLAVRRFFEAHLSYPAIGRQARAIYERWRPPQDNIVKLALVVLAG